MKKMVMSLIVLVLTSAVLFGWSYPDIWTSPDGTYKVYTFKGDPVVTDLGGGAKRTQCTDEPQINFCRVVKAPVYSNTPSNIINAGTRINIFVYNNGQSQLNGSGTGYLNVILTNTVDVNSTTIIDFLEDSQSSTVSSYSAWDNASVPTNQ